MENFVIVFLALLFFAVSIGAVDNYSNYNKTEKRVRNIIPLKNKQKFINKSIIKYKDTVIELQKLKITSQRNILKTQEANLTKCLTELNRASFHDELITQLKRTIEQQKLHIENQTGELSLRNNRIEALEATNKQNDIDQKQSESQQNIFRTQERHLTNCWLQVDSQKEIIAKLKQKNEQQEHQIQNQSKLQQTINVQENQIQNQETELALRRNKIETLADENKQKDVEINQLKKDLDYEKLKYEELLNEFGNVTKPDIENTEEKLLSKQLEDAKLENQKLLTKYEEKVRELQNEKSANKNCEKYFDELEISHGILTRFVKDLETNNTELASKYNQQTTENKNLISSNTQLSDKLTVCLTTLKQKSAVIPCDKLTCPAFGNYSAAHVVNIENEQSFKIPCNSDESNSDWSVIERRLDQSLDFNRRWIEYREGFGDFQNEFFIGLEKLHLMTKQRPHQLLIRLGVGSEIMLAKYSHFEIAGEDENYAIRSLGKFSGDAGDGMRESEGKSFSTFDRDNDLSSERNCAQISKGGWWFADCGTTNLNFKHHSRVMRLVLWNNLMDHLAPIEMLIRPT
ncbi:angiopoietin-2-like [Drosophila sulfurigaster albostrigata]|uniref:angiopoietin-2-like n=1 Tax=Drosophila sulfurigaster albostrigata TaxID=89887 RepID=UPI002D21DCAD|nr:angiopoietin-2-like [Drosophila sulfurigaster albostrigata]